MKNFGSDFASVEIIVVHIDCFSPFSPSVDFMDHAVLKCLGILTISECTQMHPFSEAEMDQPDE